MLAYLLLRGVVDLFRFVPYALLFRLSDALAFVLRVVIRYRRNVIWNNLRRAFPEKSEQEIERLARETYRNLTDVTLETMKSQTAPLAEINRRCRLVQPERVSAYMEKGQSVLLAGSHTGNWEYAGLTLTSGMLGRLVGVYKPMSNKYIDKFVAQKRCRGGITLAAMDEVLSFVRKNKGAEAWAYMLIADQSPNSRKRAHWVQFFGRETASLPGVDVLARTFHMPVFGFRIQRIRRGYYEIHFDPIWLDPSQAKEGEITEAYTRQLELEISAQPENWLWSHKRWKMTK